MYEYLGRWMVAPRSGSDGGWEMTLEEIVNQDGLPQGEGRLVHMYEVKGCVSGGIGMQNHCYLFQNSAFYDETIHFRNIPERWGDKDTPQELKVL